MKKIIIAVAAIAAALTMVSCQKEQLADSVTDVAGNDVITAYTEENLTKTSLSGDDSKGYDVLWSRGDKISIGNNTFTLVSGEGTTAGTFQGTLPKDGTYTASYKGSANNWPMNWNHSEDGIIGGPMTASVTISDGKVTEPLNFRNEGGILRLTLKGTATVREIIEYGRTQCNLRCGSVTLDNTDGKVFYLPLPAGSHGQAMIQIFTVDGLDIRKEMKYGKELVIERSKITDVSLSGINSTVPGGILPGGFSVADGSQVHFSKGNLRYTVASKKWSFFDRQYDCGPRYYSYGHDKEISLFTWGYNSTKSIFPNGKYGDNVDIKYGNLTQPQDWGSRIGDGNTWRTLTMSEWEYLFNVRTNADKKYGFATVGGVKGLIILPDEFKDPCTNESYRGFTPQQSMSHWTDNIYASGEDWAAMEYAGAVFLPVAGSRSGSEVTFFDSLAWYWSSTAEDMYHEDSDDRPSPAVGNAFTVYFGSYSNNISEEDFKPVHPFKRDVGCSVRLVTNIITVTFDLNGKPGTAPQSIGILYNSPVTKPADPSAEGYVFTGWYKEPECKNQWNFAADLVTANTTLYAGWTDGLISGKFTINSSGKQVYFSRGNLWADGSKKLYFEDKQWGFKDSYSSSHVSHFTWSESVDKAVGTTGSGTYLFCNGDHKVSVNGSLPIYYALSREEWKYLFKIDSFDENAREMSHGSPTHSFNINYCGTRGLVIYPDDYNGYTLSSEENYTEETFPKGCVFLPGAGWRDNTTVKLVGNWNGFYWSSSKNGDSNPFYLQFVTDELNLSAPGDQNNGVSIRLVTNVE